MEEQQRAVEGHINLIAGDWSSPSGLAFISTNVTDEGSAMLVAEAFSQWESNSEQAVRVAVYGEDTELLYADD
ncbi:hypothetical protein [Streptomyces sp. NBC_01803]|uniref:hypothetical protein n=1 Tax=Streptomyces sp. NBC_01803 TaxID=2975946 RepID=UPI002DD7AA46|nr:hypothetical protein [Streptomyces sp. NBC_01803]WSA42963.1 hypothetical protein OIE51_01340 [Streptomyces sp. NBC_01803]